MKFFSTSVFFTLLIVFLSLYSKGQGIPKEIPKADHPRLMLLGGEEKQLTDLIAGDKDWAKLHGAILEESNRIIEMDVLERKQIGRRLLSVSREAIRRIFYLSYAYRLTHLDKYAKRAEKEMQAIAGFSDWNPSHFLDVAEMTMAMAIGYDWLYDVLSPEAKKVIREAIVKKGIEPSYKEEYNWFLKATHNWNQVCNAGMTFGALAVYEDHPDLAQKTIERAITTIPLPMEDYKPDGAYPEGYSYWDYGTTFNVLFLSAIEKVYGTDFGLSETPGFLNAGGFYQHMTGVTGMPYNWGDAGSGAGSLSPAMFWFAQKNKDPSLLWVEKDYLLSDDFTRYTRNRILPAALIWGKDLSIDSIQKPSKNAWMGQGANPVAMFRTSWSDPHAIYLGFKAGSPSVNHGHMDIGSFIMESDGIRWAMDFGSQNYESLESKGIQLFGRTQDAQRWTVFRLNNYVHNTLTFDDELQRVKGYAQIEQYSENQDFMFATTDFSSVYEGQIQKGERGVGIVQGKYVLIQDEINTLDKPTTLRWNMLTPAQVTITGDETAVLEKDGKKLMMKIEGPPALKLQTWSTDPKTDYDAPNPGTIRVGFEYELSAQEATTFRVYLIPEATVDKLEVFKGALEDWGK